MSTGTMKQVRALETEEEFDHCDGCGCLAPVADLERQDALCNSCFEKAAAGDPRLNAHGVYERGINLIRIPLGKSAYRCEFELVRKLNGRYCYGYRFQFKTKTPGATGAGEHVGRPTVDGPEFPAAIEALAAGVDQFLAERDLPAGVVSSAKAWRTMLLKDELDLGLDDEPELDEGFTALNGITGEWSNGGAPPANGANGKHKRSSPAKGKLSAPPAKAPRPNLYDAVKPPAGEGRRVSIDSIHVADNVRKEFDQAEIDSLAATLGQVGMLQRPIVRPINLKSAIANPKATYELVAGERRLRAAIKAGWTELNVLVQDLDDVTRLRVQFTENLQRKDLNPIETAELLARATKPVDAGGLGLTQAEAGQLMTEPISQTRVSQAISLLTLPDWVQEHVIRRRITPKHAEALARWCGQPAVERIARRMVDEHFDDLAKWRKRVDAGKANEDDEPTLTAAEICGWRWEITRNLSELSGHDYDYEASRSYKYHVDPAKLDDKTRTALDLVELGGVTYAANKKLATTLVGKAKAEAKKNASDRKDAKAAKQAAELTPAELKARKAKLDEQFARRLDEWWQDWRRVVVANHLDDQPWAPGLLAMWAVCELSGGGSYRCDWEPPEALEQVAASAGLPDVGRHGRRGLPIVEAILEALVSDPKRLRKVGNAFARSMLVSDGLIDGQIDPVGFVDPPMLDVLVRVLSIDLAAEWSADRKSALRESYWELHGKGQLEALGGECGVYLGPNLKKSAMISILLGQERPLPFPAELAKLAGVAKKKLSAKRNPDKSGGKR